MAPNWGIVSTVLAPTTDILNFAAHHLDLGAHRLYLHLDDADPQARDALGAHPKIRVIPCDAAWWARRGGRPAKHQVRQAVNATHAYGRRAEVRWLIHLDVDEFLWPAQGIAPALAALPPDRHCARVRPMELLAGGDGTACKGFIPAGPDRTATVRRLYPQFGSHVRGGFLSHLAGKLFVRTGLGPLTVRIHNVMLGDETNPGETELETVALCHRHARSWEDWIAAFRFRHARGAYRAGLAPALPRESGGLSLHELLAGLETDRGEAGLRAFFDEVCADSPELRGRLRAEGLLRRCDLQLDAKRRKHFPDRG